MKLRVKLLALVAAATASLAPSLLLANPASAAVRDGVCDTGEFCYYYNSNEAGSVSDFDESVGDYGTTQPSCYEFKGPGNGQGLCIKNNAASVWNRTGQTVTVYFNSNYGGASQSFAAGAKANLNATLKNNDASHKIGSTTSGSCTYTGNPHTCAQAIAWADSHLGATGLHVGWCDHYVGVAYGYPTGSGSTTAVAHWNSMPSTYKHPGNDNAPAGTLAFFSGGSQGYGHVMISLGGGEFASTDISPSGSYGPGDYNKTTITGLQHAFGTGEVYLGWAQPWFPAGAS